MTTEHLTSVRVLPLVWYKEALTRLVTPRVDRVIVISRAQLPRIAKLGYPSESVRMIPNAIPQPKIATVASSIRSPA
jgi:hypothetical protein